MASEASALRSINMVWWGCIGSVFIYSALTILLGGRPLGEGFNRQSDTAQVAIFFLALGPSLVAATLPFTLLGRKHLQRMTGTEQIVRSAFLRMALTEVAVILGIAIFVVTGSYEMYIPFFLISALSLLLLRRELNVYREVLHALH